MNLMNNLFYLKIEFVCNECAIMIETMEMVMLSGKSNLNIVDCMDRKVLNGYRGIFPQVTVDSRFESFQGQYLEGKLLENWLILFIYIGN